MAHSFKITDGTTEHELVYDAASQTDYKLQYGMLVELMQPNVTMHQPDLGESLPVRATDRNRTVFLTINVDGSDWDTVYTNVTNIKRMVDGAHSQALRYWTDGDVDRVTLRIQMDGATNYTDIPVKFGMVDDSAAYYTTASVNNTTARNVVVALVVSPYGEGQPFVLDNHLASSPHFLEDSDGDGLADGWQLIGTPTVNISPNFYLTGGASQKFTTDNSTNEGIRSDTVTASTSSDIVAYAWVYHNSGDGIYVRLFDGSNNLIASKQVTAANATKSTTGFGGQTWHKIVVSGQNTAAANCYLRIGRRLADATQQTIAFVDNCYLEVGTQTAPAGWCSSRSIENRNDPDSTNESEINYFDVWGVPGDADALRETKVTVDSTTDAVTQTIASRSDGKQEAIKLTHWIESNDFGGSPTDWSDQSDATRTGGSYKRLNAATAIDKLTIYSFEADDEPHLFNTPVHIFLIARTSHSSNTFTIKVSSGGLIRYQSDAVAPQTLNQWSFLHVGLVNIPEGLESDSFLLNSTAYTVSITGAGSTGNVDFDAMLILPADQYFIGEFFSAGTDRYILGTIKKYMPLVGSDIIHRTHLGDMWTVKSGETVTRTIFVFHGNAGATIEDHDIARTATVSVRITPRTRHLLGVQ